MKTVLHVLLLNPLLLLSKHCETSLATYILWWQWFIKTSFIDYIEQIYPIASILEPLQFYEKKG